MDYNIIISILHIQPLNYRTIYTHTTIAKHPYCLLDVKSQYAHDCVTKWRGTIDLNVVIMGTIVGC